MYLVLLLQFSSSAPFCLSPLPIVVVDISSIIVFRCSLVRLRNSSIATPSNTFYTGPGRPCIIFSVPRVCPAARPAYRIFLLKSSFRRASFLLFFVRPCRLRQQPAETSAEASALCHLLRIHRSRFFLFPSIIKPVILFSFGAAALPLRIFRFRFGKSSLGGI